MMHPGSPKAPVWIASVATASPESVLTQPEAAEILAAAYGRRLRPRSLQVLRRVFAHPSVRRRGFVYCRPEDLIDEDLDRRVERFTRGAVGLGVHAARRALEAAEVAPSAVATLVVNTCTGYVCPGLSNYVAEALGLRPDLRAYDLVGSGCGGAVPNLELAAGSLADGGSVALSISVEVCSATFQMGDDLSLIISNALFADGAAAAVLRPKAPGLRIIDSASLHLPQDREACRFIHRGGQLHNQLAKDLPERVASAVGRLVPALLDRNGLRTADIGHWVVHPGGDKVLGSVAAALGLSDTDLRDSYEVLREYGNLSSPTVWFVLRRALDAGLRPGEFLLMLGYGAGMSAHACLLEAEQVT